MYFGITVSTVKCSVQSFARVASGPLATTKGLVLQFHIWTPLDDKKIYLYCTQCGCAKNERNERSVCKADGSFYPDMAEMIKKKKQEIENK